MPTNKNAAIRYQTLDKCFRDALHRYFLEDLKEKCNEALYAFNGDTGVGRRQIFEDIRFMESEAGWQIPLERLKEGKRVYYRYADTDFTINEQPLTEKEARQVETLIVTLSRFRGMPSNEWVEDVISNLEWRFKLKRSEHKVIGFEKNDQLKGLHFLSSLIDAAVHRQVLDITYQSYKEASVERKMSVHPYYLKEYNNRWFLMGLDAETGYICNLALDRIHRMEINEKEKFIPSSIDFDHYFDDVIGVTIPDEGVEKEKIELQFNVRQFAYIKSKPLHPSQKIVSENERIVSIEVRPNYELDYHILSLGPDAEVLSPLSYREHLKRKIQETLQKYSGVQIERTEEN